MLEILRQYQFVDLKGEYFSRGMFIECEDEVGGKYYLFQDLRTEMPILYFGEEDCVIQAKSLNLLKELLQKDGIYLFIDNRII